MKKQIRAALLALLCLAGQVALAAGYRVESVSETDVFQQDGVKLAELHAAYPQLAGLQDEDAMGRINRSIRDHVLLEGNYEGLKEIALEDYSSRARDFSGGYFYSLYVESQTKWESGRMLGVLFSYSYFAGGAHPDNWRTAVMYDLLTGAPVALGEMVGDVDAFRTAVADAVLLQIQQKGYAKTYDYFEGYEDTVRAWPLEQALFTKDGLLVFFNPAEIGPYSSGPQTFVVPFEAVEGLLNALGKALLGTGKGGRLERAAPSMV